MVMRSQRKTVKVNINSWIRVSKANHVKRNVIFSIYLGCICDRLGTEHCDSYTGICHCHPNVIGSKCDRCEADHYGFESGQGCTPCDCAVASNSTQCDDNTGSCA